MGASTCFIVQGKKAIQGLCECVVVTITRSDVLVPFEVISNVFYLAGLWHRDVLAERSQGVHNRTRFLGFRVALTGRCCKPSKDLFHTEKAHCFPFSLSLTYEVAANTHNKPRKPMRGPWLAANSIPNLATKAPTSFPSWGGPQ